MRSTNTVRSHQQSPWESTIHQGADARKKHHESRSATLPSARHRRNHHLACALALALVAGLVLCTTSSIAATRSPHHRSTRTSPSKTARKVLVVVIDRIGINDLMGEDTPNIRRLIDRGSVALMNARVRFDQYGQGSYVIIGAGGRAVGGFNVGLAFNHGERLLTPEGKYVTAGEIYRARTGRVSPAGSVGNLYIEEMKKKSDVPQASSVPGLMGEALRKNGKKVAVVGNADSFAPAPQVETSYQVEFLEPVVPSPGSSPVATLLRREVSCIAMDANGLVPQGDVSPDLYHTSSNASGVTTAFGKLQAETLRDLQSSDVVVVDMGQTTRVDDQADFYSDAALARARALALRQCDRSLGAIVDTLDLSRDLVVVCTPTPTRKMILEGNLVTPLVVAGPGFSPGTRLASPSTRRTGIVSNFDIAPTVLNSLGVAVPVEMDGRALESRNVAPDLPALKEFDDHAAGASLARKNMVRVYAITAMSLVALLFIVVLLREDSVRRHRVFWSIVMLSILSGPLVFLVIPSFAVPALGWLIPAAAAGSALIGSASLFLAGRASLSAMKPNWDRLVRPLAAVSGVTLAFLLVDVLLGSPLMTFSAFGSDVMMGDRYYGMGNLYTGFAIGAALLFACQLPSLLRGRLDKPWKRYVLCGAVLAVTAFIMGFGRLGAEFGGLVAILTGSLVALMKFDGGRIGLKRVAVIVAVVVVCVVVIVGADMLLPGTSSHAGKAVSGAEHGRVSAVYSTVSRKLATNWTLTFTSIWRLLLLFLFIACIALNWRYHLFRRLKEEVPYLYAGFVGMAIALPVAWFLNDSGIEAAASLGVFLFVPYLYLLVWSLKQSDSKLDDS